MWFNPYLGNEKERKISGWVFHDLTIRVKRLLFRYGHTSKTFLRIGWQRWQWYHFKGNTDPKWFSYLSKHFQIEMKQFLAIHHLKRTGDFPKASDQEELEDVMQKIFKDKVIITFNLTLNPFIMTNI